MWMLRLIKVLQSIRRRLFGEKAPEWLTELTKLIQYFDLIRLAPTLYMIFFAPKHFFRRLPEIRRETRPYYLTPLQFVTNLAVLQFVLLTFFFPDGFGISEKQMVVGNLVVVLASPLLIACTCLVVLVLWYLCAHIWPINHIAQEIPFNHHGAIVPLSLFTYANLDGSRYFWSLFYFYLYFYSMLVLIAAGFGLAEIAIWDVYSSKGGKIYINKITIIPFALIGFFSALAAYWILVRPYIILLLMSSQRLTKRMALFVLVDENT